MNEDKNNPIRQLTSFLADLIIRLTNTERELDEARKSSDEWYQHWQRKDAELKEAQAKLAEEIEAHQQTRKALREALETSKKKGAHHNG